MRPVLTLLCSFFLFLLTPSPAYADGGTFAPCADRSDFPELRGTECLVAKAALHPGAKGAQGEVELFVRKFPVGDRARRRGDVWLIAGGPGEPGASLYPLIHVFRRAFPQHDLIVPDHRGTGRSTRLCPEQEAMDGLSGSSLADAEWGACIGFLHADAPRAHAFNITNAARDLSGLIARHGGDGESLVYSVSYGTQLALRMMQVAPPELDGLILDGLVPPEGATPWELSRRTALVDRVGRAILSAGQERAYRRLLTRADAPWHSTVPGGDLRRFMGSLLNFPRLRARIPMLVRTLSRGDTRLLARTRTDLEATFAAMLKFPHSSPSIPLVMLISASENNSRPGLTAETVADEARDALFTSPLPGFLVGSPMPLYKADRWLGQSPARLPRTLIIHGTLDPNTAYEGAIAQAKMLGRAGKVSFVSVDRGAHLLPLVAPDCFVRSVSLFVSHRTPAKRCRT